MEDMLEVMAKVEAAITDEASTVGTSVAWGYAALIAGNTRRDGPALSPVLIDDLGRLWKERHHLDTQELVCVLDLRVFDRMNILNPEPLITNMGAANRLPTFKGPMAPGSVLWIDPS